MKGFPKGDPRAVAAAKKGGAIRGAQRQRESIAIWLERFPMITADAAREIYTQGYRSGWQAGSKAQRRQAATR